MSDVRWIKITTSVFDDEKIKLIETLPDADMIIVIWFKLLSLAGRCNDCGMVYLTRDVPYNDEMLSTIMRRPVNTVRLALHEFCKLGMIEIHDNFISIVNWDKHQNIDGLEKMREKTRKRVQNFREKQRLQIECNVTKRNSNALEKNREEKNRIDNILMFWNEQPNLTKHKSVEKHESKIRAALKTYSVDEIKNAISQYSRVTDLPGSLYSYKWILKDFLQRGLDKFAAGLPDENFVSKKIDYKQIDKEREEKEREEKYRRLGLDD